MGLYVFSLSAEEKSIFLTGESDILSVSMADAACTRVSKTRRGMLFKSRVPASMVWTGGPTL